MTCTESSPSQLDPQGEEEFFDEPKGFSMQDILIREALSHTRDVVEKAKQRLAETSKEPPADETPQP